MGHPPVLSAMGPQTRAGKAKSKGNRTGRVNRKLETDRKASRAKNLADSEPPASAGEAPRPGLPLPSRHRVPGPDLPQMADAAG
jgi:hypothetical protein